MSHVPFKASGNCIRHAITTRVEAEKISHLPRCYSMFFDVCKSVILCLFYFYFPLVTFCPSRCMYLVVSDPFEYSFGVTIYKLSVLLD
jgi:hypothetical protein